MSDTKNCPDCAVAPGTAHEIECDVARCLEDGGQRLMHSMFGVSHDCGKDVWTGEWPMVAEAIEHGWYSYFDKGWVRCDKDHPGAAPDLNRVLDELKWDREAQRWVDKVSAVQKLNLHSIDGVDQSVLTASLNAIAGALSDVARSQGKHLLFSKRYGIAMSAVQQALEQAR